MGLRLLSTILAEGHDIRIERFLFCLSKQNVDAWRDHMIFTIQCDDGSEYVSEMASPLPSGNGECRYTVTNHERWFPEDEYEVHSVSWSLTYSIE
jgi:hypothetical protein